MGHIELAAPVSHIWYFKGIPSRLGLILDMSPRALEKVLYFAQYIVTEAGDTSLSEKQLLSEMEYREYKDHYKNAFKAEMGAEAIKKLLEKIDLEKESVELKSQLRDSKGQKKIRITRRLEVIEAFRVSGNRPEWMILDVVPVIPPELRPMVQLDGGRFATSDLNDLYRRVINRNNRLKRLLDLGAPDIIVRNEKRMLQEAVDALIDNGRRGRPVTGPGNRPLKSLSDMLKGKQGRFRQNLLGKRVDYSGRSVIVVGPELKFNQCGLPKKMALELFKPFVMKKLVENGSAHNIKSAKKKVEKVDTAVWDVLDEIIKDHTVMLNRAPTLHRLGIQSFEPVLVEGKAIKLHPLVCTAYNADFDGDQMADMVLGSYYMTLEIENSKGHGMVFKDYDEMMMAYFNKEVDLHAKVKIRRTVDNETRLVESTVGRFIFNEDIPQDLGFVDREKDKFSLEIDKTVTKKQLEEAVYRCFRKYGNSKTADVLDGIKSKGYQYSTKGAITISVSDITVPDEKKELIEKAEKQVIEYEKKYRRGLMTDDERYENVIKIWNQTTEDVTEALMNNLNPLNSIYIMSVSGARGGRNQIKQLAGMRGLMASATGKTVEVPVKSNFREGLTVLEFFLSATGARKGFTDTALRTADSGYLTRRLVDVSQDVIVREVDCGTTDGIEVESFIDGKEVIEEMSERCADRFASDDVLHPETGEVMVKSGGFISEVTARKIQDSGINTVKVRSVLTCKTPHGVCAKCYGTNLATGKLVTVGEAVGIIAAQSIGEPGTQLTMRTFHTGGIAAASAITQGLPRIEELFEARKPKGQAIISEIPGKVTVTEKIHKREVTVTNNDSMESKTYLIPYGSKILVSEGEYIEAGDKITDGSINPHDIMSIKGMKALESYILMEVQRVYRMQGVDISDKHVEVIIRQMVNKVRIEDSNDTTLLSGSLVSGFEFKEQNDKAVAEGKEPATGEIALLGITKSSLATDSFLASASFQETTRVLTDAATKGKVDNLLGLKENVIIGRLIPAGTGMKKYRNIGVTSKDVESEETEEAVGE